MLFFLFACSKDNVCDTPFGDGAVIDINMPDFASLQTVGGTVTVNRGSGYQEVVITRQVCPVYQGAVVVCQGAGNAAVRLAVVEAISALTGLSSDKISVVKWKQS